MNGEIDAETGRNSRNFPPIPIKWLSCEVVKDRDANNQALFSVESKVTKKIRQEEKK